MRIISDFHDYYDETQKFGQDLSVNYLRKTLEVSLDNDRNMSEELKQIKSIYMPIYSYITDIIEQKKGGRWGNLIGFDNLRDRNEKNMYEFGMFFVVFAGSLYPCVKATKKIPIESCNETFIYNKEDFYKYMLQENIDIERKVSRWDKKTISKYIDSVFDMPSIQGLQDFLIKSKVINLIRYRNKLIINPNLSKIEFYKAVEPYKAYQDLDVWVSGTLSYPQNELIEIPDKYKILEHGFDKHSFRKAPTKKR